MVRLLAPVKGKVIYSKIMSQIKRLLSLSGAALIFWSGPLFAEYTLVLKNGQRIAVQNYREEGGVIKFYTLGGEVGIPKDQVRSILRGTGEGVSGAERSPVGSAATSQGEEKDKASPSAGAEEKGEGLPEAKERVPTPDEGRAEEEKVYQKRLREIDEQIRTARGRYSLLTQGTGKPEGGLTPEGGVQGWLTDLSSRTKDAQKSPPSEYTPQERELSELRSQIQQLEKERESLIGEMKQKGFEPTP